MKNNLIQLLAICLLVCCRSDSDLSLDPYSKLNIDHIINFLPDNLVSGDFEYVYLDQDNNEKKLTCQVITETQTLVDDGNEYETDRITITLTDVTNGDQGIVIHSIANYWQGSPQFVLSIDLQPFAPGGSTHFLLYFNSDGVDRNDPSYQNNYQGQQTYFGKVFEDWTAPNS